MGVFFDVEDEILARWLSAISPLICHASFSPTSISIQPQSQVINICCTHRYMALQIRRYDDLLKNSKYGVNILVGGKKYAFIPPSKPMPNNILKNTTLENSSWAMLNSQVLDVMSDDGTVSIHSVGRDGGYKILTICPYQRIDQVLCLPKEQLVQKAVMEGFDAACPETEIIAQTKRRVIEEAIASNSKITHTYEMMWNGILWQKSVTGVLVNENEVLCITRNLQEYQRKYWENFVG